VELHGKLFYLAHGDGLGDKDVKFRFLRAVFHNKICQSLFAAVHPRWGVDLGLFWAKHSRLKRAGGREEEYKGEDKEYLVQYAKQYLKTHPDINYFIFGHRHIELDLSLGRESRLMILGDWINEFSFAVFDGEHMFLEEFIEGESKL
jgi:UDP-2,3-diacylglucosamine hydrolase